jgi:hypothetical protein
MHLVRQTFSFVSTTVTIVILAAAASGYSEEAVNDAEDLLRQAKARFSIGEVTRTDVAQAEYHLLEMKYEAGWMPKTDYCQQALPILEVQGNGLVEEASVGQRTTQDVIDYKRKFYKFKVLCR